MAVLFHQLNEEEIQLIKDAIPLITILIAGADGNIDQKEREWAEKITKIRSYSSPEIYHEFYNEIGNNFQEKLDQYITRFPDDAQARGEAISGELSKLNAIFAKLHPRDGSNFYKEFVRFAEHVAKASGGFLGFMTVSVAEKQWLGLPMLDEIEYHGEGEEEE